MTRDDFEDITALPLFNNRGIKIELTYLGFKVSSVNQDFIISYLEASEAKYPVELFRLAIDKVLQ